MVSDIINYISILLALMIVLPLHEFAHAFAAVKHGDLTPKLNNRYTLNPLAHFDLIGLVCFALVGFGWAKPVPVNPNNFNNYKKGCFWVSIAGVLSNYLLAFLVYPIMLLLVSFLINIQIGYFTDVIIMTLAYVYKFSLSFFVFNLLPIYPLDGFRVLDVFNRRRGKIYRFLRDKGIYVLYGLFFLGIIADITNIWQLDILGILISKLSNILGFPIKWFWGLIFYGRI